MKKNSFQKVVAVFAISAMVLSNLSSIKFPLISLVQIPIAHAGGGEFNGGTGTTTDPYQIKDCTELQNISNHLAAHYVLTSDIDCSLTDPNNPDNGTSVWAGSHGFNPVGTFSSPFTGNFDGQEHTISNLYIARSDATDPVGLFGSASGATIQKVGLSNVSITGAAGIVTGALLGSANHSTTSRVFVSGGTVTEGTGFNGGTLGGLVGVNGGGSTITNSYANVAVSSSNDFVNIGGLAGSDGSSTIEDCYSIGQVSATGNNPTVGGLFGQGGGGTVNESYYDYQTSGQGDSNTEYARSTAQMKSFDINTNGNTFYGWYTLTPSAIWVINGDNFPTLQLHPYYDSGTVADQSTLGSGSTANVAIGSAATPVTTALDWNNSLVAWWPFNDHNGADTNVTALDDVVHQGQHTLTNHNATFTQDEGSKYGGYFNFDGEGSYMQTNSTSGFDVANNFSISAWINPAATNGIFRILSKDDKYSFGVDNGGLRFTTYGETDYVTTNAAVTAGQWQLVTVTFDTSNTARFYVNGTLTDTVTGGVDTSAFLGDSAVEIGRGCQESCDQYFHGNIDDVQFYSRTLAADEVASLYDGHANPYNHNFTNLALGGYGFMPYQETSDGTITSADSTRQFTVSSTLPLNSCADVKAINNNLAGNYTLSKDLDCTLSNSNDEGVDNVGNNIMVGTAQAPFTGTFDGQGNTIKISVVQDNQNEIGLFRVTRGATVQNLMVTGFVNDIALNSGDTFNGNSIGGVIGHMYGGTIQNVASKASARGGQFVGGLIGSLENNGDYSADDAEHYLPHVSEDYAIGDVYGNNAVGGLIGFSSTAATIDRVYARGNVFGASNLGGLIGQMHQTQITNAYARGNVSNQYAPLVPVGTFHISQLVGANYVEKYQEDFPKNYKTKEFLFTPLNHKVQLQINQKHIPYADVDQIKLSACGKDISPEYARYASNGKDLIEDLSSIDNNVVVSHESPINISWNIPQTCTSNAVVSLTANEYGEGSPLIFTSHFVAGQTNTYSPNWVVTSGHPQGPTYVTATDDANNVYFKEEVTSDNTNEIHQDWTDLQINGKTFRVDDQHPQYGTCTFGLTDKVSYKHNTCDFIIPKSEIGTANFNFRLRYYGTASTSGYGGLIGEMDDSATLLNTYATGNVLGDTMVGGLVGTTQGGSITNSFASNFYVQGNSMIGGLVGYNNNSANISGGWYTADEVLPCFDSGSSPDVCTATAANSPTDFYGQNFDSGWRFDTTWDDLSSYNPANSYFPTLRPTTLDGIISENIHLKNITDCEDLMGVVLNDNSENNYYFLTRDLSQQMNCSGWSTTYLNGTFKGVLDGNGHEIYMSLTGTSAPNLALLQTLSGGTVKNLGLVGTISGAGNVGSLAAHAENFSIIDNVSSAINVSGQNDAKVGGLIGSADSTLFTNDQFNSNVSAPTSAQVGGIAGYASNSVIYANRVEAPVVDGLNKVGGIAGEVANTSIINSSIHTGDAPITITAESPVVQQGALGVGGIIGYALKPTVQGVTVNGGVTIKGFLDSNTCDGSSCSVAGGLIGYADFTYGGSIESSTVASGVTLQGYSFMGGLIGSSIGGFNITDSSSAATFDLSSIAQHEPSYLGGLIGSAAATGTPAAATMTGSSSSSDIDTTAHLGLNTGNFGGLIGSMISDGTIPVHFDHDYSTGNIVGGIQSGGLFGTLATGNGGVVQNSYSTGSVSGAAASHGGAIGFLNNGSGTLDINNIFAHGSVAGGGYVGGLVGELGNAFDPSFNTKITNSYEWGNVSGDSEVGGIVGLSHIDNDDDTNLSEIKNVYASGNVSGTGNTIGGLIGDQEGTALIHYNFYDGATVTGSNPLTYGSLIGYAGTAGVLRNLYYSSSPDGPNPTQCIVHGNGNLNDDACVTKTRADFMGINNTFLSDTVQFDNEATWSFRDGHNPDLAFTTVDDPGVMNMISDVAATPDTTSVVITWTTNDVGSTRVNYGLSAQLGTYTTEKDTSPRVTSHSVTISSLTACTTYHYEVISSDSLSQPHSSGGDKTFKTTGCSTGGDNGGGTGGVVLVPQGGGGGGSWGGGSSSVSTQQQTQQNTQQQQQEDCVAVKLTGSEPFTDEIGHWSHNCVLALYLQNVVQGRAPHLYVPEGTLTRAEAIKIGLLAFGYKTDVTTPSGFTDLNAKSWYVPFIRKAKAIGVIAGTKFHPNDAITRADALEIFLKMAKKLDQEPAGPFTDVDQKAEYAPYVNYGYAKGVIKGRTASLFMPNGTITRAEIAKIVSLIKLL